MQSKYGKRMRELREKNNDTLGDLAKKLNMAFGNLGKYERGERRITPELLEQIAEVYDVPLSYFYGDDDGEVPKELREIGVEWIRFAKEMDEKEITPDEIKAIISFMKKVKE
ncbi:MAG: hypothetical protein K0Q73_5964 [Paenibacillus sp.]|nr:hypothetical protein [Paenibacillus sp.]